MAPTRRFRHTTTTVPAVLLTLASLTGCAATTPETPTTGTTPNTTATPLFTNDTEALAAAKAAWERLLKVDDAISQDGGLHAERLDAVELDPALTTDKRGYADLVKSKTKFIGNSVLAGFKLQSASATGTVKAYVCLDESGVGMVDATGATTYPNKPDTRQTFIVTFVTKDGQLLPSSREPWGKASPCDS